MSVEAGKLLELERRLSMVESHKKLTAASQESELLRSYQIETLQRLRSIREELSNVGGVSSPAAAAELEQLRAEKAKFEKETSHLKYRVEILIKALKEAEAKAIGNL